MEEDMGRRRADFVLGDCHGSACAPLVTETARRELESQGYLIACNSPYSGGFVTRHYGRPQDGVHALQIEINRALYMDETAIRRHSGLDALAERLSHLVASLGAVTLDQVSLRPSRAAE